MKLKLKDDPNFLRRDMWFSRADEVAPFMQHLYSEHPNVDPKLVSAALLQARKNLVVGPQRQCLKKEVSRLLQLSHYWSAGALRVS